MRFPKVIHLLIALLSLVVVGGCTSSVKEKDKETQPEIEAELFASKRSVSVSEAEEVEFTVSYDGRDVTDQSKIYHFVDGRSHKLESNSFVVEREGENLFYAIVGSHLTSKIAVYGVVDPVTLSADRSYVALDSEAPIHFIVECQGRDVTEESTIYFDNGGNQIELEGNTTSFEELGQYKFYAKFNSIPSNDLNIRVLNNILEPLVDSQAERFDSFVHRVLALHIADVGCSPCVAVARLIHAYLGSPFGEPIVFAAAHGPIKSADPMTCLASTTVIAGLEVKMFPTLSFALTPLEKYALHSAESIPEKSFDALNLIVDELLSKEVKSAISAHSNLSDGVLSVRADVKINTDGNYGVGVWLVEDNIYHPQAGAQENEFEALSRHNGVIRDIYPLSKSLAIDLGGVNAHKAGKRYECCCDFNIEPEYGENLRLVVFVYDYATRLVDNVATVALGEALPFEYRTAIDPM